MVEYRSKDLTHRRRWTWVTWPWIMGHQHRAPVLRVIVNEITCVVRHCNKSQPSIIWEVSQHHWGWCARSPCFTDCGKLLKHKNKHYDVIRNYSHEPSTETLDPLWLSNWMQTVSHKAEDTRNQHPLSQQNSPFSSPSSTSLQHQ